MRLRRVVIPIAMILVVVFGVYLWTVYQQLQSAFTSQEEFVPTRIYSDVTRIVSSDPRSKIEARLSALGYTLDKTGEKSELRFRLHPVDFPTYLIPDVQANLQPPQAEISLQFDSPAPDALLLAISANGTEIPELYLEPELVATLSRGNAAKNEVRELIKFEEIPAQVWKAIIAIEDQHFLEHSGFDPRGLARAIWVNLRTFSLAQGGSTITQQLVKNLTARRDKNVFRKINELFLSLLLETSYAKEQILERYLNEVYLGQIGSLEVHGVAEGAKHFFGKRLEELNLAEVALMAGLIRGPGYYSPYRYRDRAMERQRLVLRRMVETGHVAEGEVQAALEQPIRLAPPQTTANKAPFFTDFVKAELLRQLGDRISEQEISQAGFRVYTTLDMNLNGSAQNAVAGGLGELERKAGLPVGETLEGALAAVDQSTGFLRALIGGRSYARSNFNRILNMRRQVGSTFKPVVYLTALAQGFNEDGVPYGPGYPVEDSAWKLTYDRGLQIWKPANYEKGYKGWMSMRQGLAHSVNTVAAKIGMEVGIDEVIRTARNLGVRSELPAVPSLSLGVAELSPIELLQIYATLANHGLRDELTVIRGITHDDGKALARFVYHPEQVFSAGPVDLLTDMLQSVFAEGTARGAQRMGFDRPAAGKTGTTSHHRDAWFAGYTPQLTAVVWVGMDQQKGEGGTPATRKYALTGSNSALPIWVNFMNEALLGQPPLAFPVSPHLANVMVDKYTGNQASEDCPGTQVLLEKYVRGFEPTRESCEMLWPPTVPETESP